MKAEAAGVVRAAAKEHATAAAGEHEDWINGGVLAVHDFDISPRVGL
jgi:hypothetical protein